MAIDPAILGGAVILGGGNSDPQPTCTIQMPDGTSSKGLECIVQPISHMSDGQLSLIIGGSLLFVGIVFVLILVQEHRADKRWLEQQRIYTDARNDWEKREKKAQERKRKRVRK